MPERWIKTLKEQCLWTRLCDDVDDLRQAVASFVPTYDTEWHFSPFGRLAYAASPLACTPKALSQEGHALGTLVGETRLTEIAHGAGSTRVRRTPVEAPVNLLLEARR